jgi:hypothetical protein
MKKIILFFVLLILISCAVKNTQERGDQLFSNYLKTLDKIDLPFHHSSVGEFPELSKKYDSLGFAKYKHVWTSKPLGKLFETDSIVVLVDLSIGDNNLVPFITTFDRFGNKIDSLGPYEKSGGDIGYQAVEYLTINKDRFIIVVDTVETWKLNEDESDIIEDSSIVTSDTTIYHITNTGKIVKK